MRYDTERLQARGISPAYVEVLLNGEVIKRAIAFDPAEGYVEVYRMSEDGKTALVEDEKFVVNTLRGKVVAYLLHMPSGKWPHPGLPAPDAPKVLLTSVRT